MKAIVYTNPDQSVSIVRPDEGARLAVMVTLSDGQVLQSASPQSADSFLRLWPVDGAVAQWAETEDEFVARVQAKDVPAGVTNVFLLDESALPADRTFRNAWRGSAGAISVDMDKARAIHRNKMRAVRAPKLEAMDVLFMKAQEAGDSKAQASIAAAKQVLRDVPADPAIAAAQTPEQLNAVWPDSLK